MKYTKLYIEKAIEGGWRKDERPVCELSQTGRPIVLLNMHLSVGDEPLPSRLVPEEILFKK